MTSFIRRRRREGGENGIEDDGANPGTGLADVGVDGVRACRFRGGFGDDF